MELARKAHLNQVDKGGKPYIDHPLAVSSMLESEDEKIVALLHDVCEDSQYTLTDLKEFGFDAGIVAAVDLLTKRSGDSYEEYMHKISQNPLAVNVKIADMTHNSDLSRLANPGKKDFLRAGKYKKWITFLTEYQKNQRK